MDRVFWLRPGRLAGRPGPNTAPWDPRRLKAAGIGAVLSVNDGQECEPTAFVAADLEHACIPFSRNAPPVPGDAALCADALPRAFHFASSAIGRSRPVLVHCTYGKDRTGMFMAYFLIREEGLDPDSAMRAVRQARPNAFSAEGWEDLSREVLERAWDRATRDGATRDGATRDGATWDRTAWAGDHVA